MSLLLPEEILRTSAGGNVDDGSWIRHSRLSQFPSFMTSNYYSGRRQRRRTINKIGLRQCYWILSLLQLLDFVMYANDIHVGSTDLLRRCLEFYFTLRMLQRGNAMLLGSLARNRPSTQDAFEAGMQQTSSEQSHDVATQTVSMKLEYIEQYFTRNRRRELRKLRRTVINTKQQYAKQVSMIKNTLESDGDILETIKQHVMSLETEKHHVHNATKETEAEL